ncbi:MAG: response regulator, partial [Rhodobacteraceae bacterium]|nr:response regulator [Paracoccaceae bacterium]
DLVRRINATERCKVVCQTTDPVEGLAFLQETAPDVAFLDIEMPGLDGLALAAALPA